MLAERIDELPLQHHDIGGNAGALLGGFVRRIDRLKAELIDAPEFAAWAQQQASPREREFAAIFEAHNRMVRELGACDEGDVVRLAIRLVEDHPSARQPFQQVLIDDAQELELGAATLARTLAAGALTVAGDPLAAIWRFRGAGAARLRLVRDAGHARRAAADIPPLPGGSARRRVRRGGSAGQPVTDPGSDAASTSRTVCFWQLRERALAGAGRRRGDRASGRA